MSTHYKKIKGNKHGYCAICRSHSELNWDHVPPQSCGNIESLEISAMTGEKHIRALSQNGLKYRSLCSDCNSKRLGTQFDPFLENFVKQVAPASNLKREHDVILSGNLTYSIKPQRVARAIVGHLFATEIKRIADDKIDAPFPAVLKEYFLDPFSPLPPEIEIYCWPYLHKEIRAFSSYTLAVPGEPEFLMGHILKFYPIGFWIVFRQSSKFGINVPKLIQNKGMSLDEEGNISWDLKSQWESDWPEKPKGNFIALYNSEATSIGKRKQ
jgi:hypothetical protein